MWRTPNSTRLWDGSICQVVVVWVVGAEGDNFLHGFDASNGNPVFSGGGEAMNGLRHFVTILAAEKRFYIAADNTVYAFAFKH